MKQTIYKWGRYYLQYSPIWKQITQISSNPNIVINDKNEVSKKDSYKMFYNKSEQIDKVKQPSQKQINKEILELIKLNKRLMLSHELLIKRNSKKHQIQNSNNNNNNNNIKKQIKQSSQLVIKQEQKEVDLMNKRKLKQFESEIIKIMNLWLSQLNKGSLEIMRTKSQTLALSISQTIQKLLFLVQPVIIEKQMSIINNNQSNKKVQYQNQSSSNRANTLNKPTTFMQKIYEVDQLKKRILVKNLITSLEEYIQQIRINQSSIRNEPNKLVVIGKIQFVIQILMMIMINFIELGNNTLLNKGQNNKITLSNKNPKSIPLIDQQQLNDWYCVLFKQNNIIQTTFSAILQCTKYININSSIQSTNNKSSQQSNSVQQINSIQKLYQMFINFNNSLQTIERSSYFSKCQKQSIIINRKEGQINYKQEQNQNKLQINHTVQRIKQFYKIKIKLNNLQQNSQINNQTNARNIPILQRDLTPQQYLLLQFNFINKLQTTLTDYKHNFQTQFMNTEWINTVYDSLFQLKQYLNKTKQNIQLSKSKKASLGQNFHLFQLIKLSQHLDIVQISKNNQKVYQLLSHKQTQLSHSGAVQLLRDIITTKIHNTLTTIYNLIRKSQTNVPQLLLLNNASQRISLNLIQSKKQYLINTNKQKQIVHQINQMKKNQFNQSTQDESQSQTQLLLISQVLIKLQKQISSKFLNWQLQFKTQSILRKQNENLTLPLRKIQSQKKQSIIIQERFSKKSQIKTINSQIEGVQFPKFPKKSVKKQFSLSQTLKQQVSLKQLKSNKQINTYVSSYLQTKSSKLIKLIEGICTMINQDMISFKEFDNKQLQKSLENIRFILMKLISYLHNELVILKQHLVISKYDKIQLLKAINFIQISEKDISEKDKSRKQQYNLLAKNKKQIFRFQNHIRSYLNQIHQKIR